MRHTIKQLFLFLCLAALAIAAYLPLVDQEYRWSFEPGSEGNIVIIKEFYWLIGYPGKATLPRKMDVSQTYFSAPYIFTAVSAHIINFLSQQGIMSAPVQSSNDSLFIFSFRYTNVLFYALSAGLAYLCLFRILGISWLSFFLTASAFVLNNIALEIDLMRVDLYLLFSSVLFFYAAFRLIDDSSSKINYALFGLAFVLSASTKLNTPLYLNFPGIIVVLFLIRKNVDSKKLLILLGTLFFSSAIFFIEWFLHPGSIYPFLIDVIKEGKLWLNIAPHTPYTFYHFDSFFGHSLLSGRTPSFFKEGLLQSVVSKSLLISLISIYAAFAFLVYRVWFRFSPKLFLLLAIFIIHSAGLILGPKFIHYGYLIPFYFLMLMGFTLSELQQLRWRKTFVGMSTIWFLFPLIFYGCNYLYKLEQLKYSRLAFDTVKMQPREWILSHVKPGAKIAGHGSTYDIPPLTDLHFDFSPAFLKIPWNKPDEMMGKIPPEKNQLPQLADVILLSNYFYELRPQLVQKLVENEDNLADDSIKFKQFVLHLEEISPGITNNFLQSSNHSLSRESFMKTVISYMWNHQVTFENALQEYYNAGGANILSERLIELTTKDLFNNNNTLLNLGYTELIQSVGGMMPVYAWKQFYEDVNTVFDCRKFESPYEYYDVNWLYIIVVNEECLIRKV